MNESYLKLSTFLYHYFQIEIAQGTFAQFRRNHWTRTIWVFQFNCSEKKNSWHAPGYGWGKWTKVSDNG